MNDRTAVAVLRAAYGELGRLVAESPKRRPKAYAFTPLEDALGRWLNFLPLDALRFSSFRPDDENRIRVMAKQLVILGIAADLTRCGLDTAADITFSADNRARITLDTRDGAVTASFVVEVDDEAPLGFWPFEFELAGLDPVGRYVAPHVRERSSALDIQTALDEALGGFYS